MVLKPDDVLVTTACAGEGAAYLVVDGDSPLCFEHVKGPAEEGVE